MTDSEVVPDKYYLGRVTTALGEDDLSRTVYVIVKPLISTAYGIVTCDILPLDDGPQENVHPLSPRIWRRITCRTADVIEEVAKERIESIKCNSGMIDEDF